MSSREGTHGSTPTHSEWQGLVAVYVSIHIPPETILELYKQITMCVHYRQEIISSLILRAPTDRVDCLVRIDPCGYGRVFLAYWQAPAVVYECACSRSPISSCGTDYSRRGIET